MLQGSVLIIDTDGRLLDRRRVGSVAAALRPRVEGGLVVAVERGFALLDAIGDLTT